MKKYKNLTAISIVALIMSAALCGCGVSKDNTAAANEDAQATAAEATGTDAGTVSEGSGTELPGEGVVGEWEMVYSYNHSKYGDGTSYDYFSLKADDEYIDSKVIISKVEDKLLMDYLFKGYENSERIYGAELVYKEEAAYEGCENDKWCLELAGKFEEDEDRRVTLTDDGMLIIVESDEQEYPEDHSMDYSYTTEYRFVKKDDERLSDPENFRYFDTVTVSNVVDLVNSVANNRIIEVESGTYNFSLVSSGQIKNPRVKNNYGSVVISDISDLKIRAKDGAEVMFCIDTPDDPVLSFDCSQHISLEGITAGHNVEPGYCGGSVLYFTDVSGLNIDKCNLFGSGTYGIDAYRTYDINVTDTEIYECTYGLVDLYDIGSAQFTRCTMRDSSEYSMISINGSYDVLFEDCTFSGNRVENEYSYFVELGEYDTVTFRNCTFKDNRFYTFSNKEVNLENCKDENNSAGFKEALTEETVNDAASLKAAYDEALKKQKEIDDKLNNSTLMDQQTLNQTAYEEYELWDTLLNNIWSYLKETMDPVSFEVLSLEEREWVKKKEAKIRSDAANFEGGSMQPMIEYGSGAEITKSRVEELLGTYVK